MKKYRSEQELRELARELATKNVVYEMCEDNRQVWGTRDATKEESETLFNLFYGTFLAMRFMNNDGATGAIDAVEYIANMFLPQLNNYNTVYCRLWETWREWEEQN